jgi:predicted house-cleaning noncanonical NTP pyrophosphatase (MazG superfamily)
MYKLIRDKIPEKIRESDKRCDYAVAINDEFYAELLMAKLIEEVNEYLGNLDSMELVDIVTVVKALLKLHNISDQEFKEMYDDKFEKLGGFENRIIGFFQTAQTSGDAPKESLKTPITPAEQVEKEYLEDTETEEDDKDKHLA